MKLFKGWASARNHHSSSTIERVPNDILLTGIALQLLEVVVHHGEIKPLLLWECLEDLAILCRLTTRYQLQVCNPQPVHTMIQTIHTFSGGLLLVKHLLHAFSKVHNVPLKARSNYYVLTLHYPSMKIFHTWCVILREFATFCAVLCCQRSDLKILKRLVRNSGCLSVMAEDSCKTFCFSRY